MKKFSRDEQKKWIEKGKSAFLLFLCFWCVWLLWSVVDLYKGQISISQFFWGADNPTSAGQSGEVASENVLQMFWQFSEPELLAVTNKENREVLLNNREGYDRVVENINMALRSVHGAKAESVLNGDMEQWKTALGGDSVYVRFAGKRSSVFESQLYELRDSSFSRMVTEYQDIIIVPKSSANNLSEVFVRDCKSRNVVKIQVETDNSAIKKAISDCEGKGKRLRFAFEEKGASTPLEYDDMFAFYENEGGQSNVLIRTPRIYKSGISFASSTEVTSGLVNVFGFNPNTVRRYANTDDALIFVAETGSLSLHPTGIIEYKALGENEGVALSAKGKKNSSEYSVIAGVSGILNKIFDLCGIGDEKHDASLRITRFPENVLSEKNTIELEYFVDGIQVKVRDSAAISVVIENGVLVGFNMCVKAIEKLDEEKEGPAFFDEVEQYSKKHKGKKVLWAKPVYRYESEENETSVVWEIQGDM